MSASAGVLAAAAALVEAFGGHRVQEYFHCFTPDATFVFHSTPARLESRSSYEELWRRWEIEEGFRIMACESRNPMVRVFGDTALFVHDVETRLQWRGEEVTAHERESIVFLPESGGGRWRAVHEHLSLTPADVSRPD